MTKHNDTEYQQYINDLYFTDKNGKCNTLYYTDQKIKTRFVLKTNENDCLELALCSVLFILPGMSLTFDIHITRQYTQNQIIYNTVPLFYDNLRILTQFLPYTSITSALLLWCSVKRKLSLTQLAQTLIQLSESLIQESIVQKCPSITDILEFIQQDFFVSQPMECLLNYSFLSQTFNKRKNTHRSAEKFIDVIIINNLLQIHCMKSIHSHTALTFICERAPKETLPVLNCCFTSRIFQTYNYEVCTENISKQDLSSFLSNYYTIQFPLNVHLQTQNSSKLWCIDAIFQQQIYTMKTKIECIRKILDFFHYQDAILV